MLNDKSQKSQERKRIGIDARFYGPEQKGLGRYVQRLIENLEKTVNQEDNLEFIVFLNTKNWHQYQPKNPNFSKFLIDCPWYSFKEQIIMPWKIRQAKIDLVHFPHFNVPVFCFRPFIVTIHDLILKRFPTRRASKLGLINYWLKNKAYDWVIRIALGRAKKIIAVSEFTKQDILKYFKIKSEKIKKIYEGAPDTWSVDLVNSVKKIQKFNIKKPYFLYVGNAYPHKNLERLINAFLALNKKKYQLVLVGELDYFYLRLKKSIPQNNQIIFTDFVSDQELQALYQNALAYVFPSLCEGFGLPPLEAINYGLPIISSNASCLPEILARAAIYFNPFQVNDIKEKLKYFLNNPKQKDKLIIQGKKRIKRYNWLSMAKKTLAIYQQET